MYEVYEDIIKTKTWQIARIEQALYDTWNFSTKRATYFSEVNNNDYQNSQEKKNSPSKSDTPYTVTNAYIDKYVFSTQSHLFSTAPRMQYFMALF